MCRAYELVATRRFGLELAVLPSKDQERLWRQLPELRHNPHPDGSKRKCRLKQYDDVYRWRLGDYRVFYTVEGCRVRLLSIDHRKDAYEHQPVTGDDDGLILECDDEGALPLHPDHEPPTDSASVSSEPDTTDERPAEGFQPLQRAALERLGVPADLIDPLLAARTADELLAVLDSASHRISQSLAEAILDLAAGVSLETLLDEPCYELPPALSLLDFLDPQQPRRHDLDETQRAALEAIAQGDGPFLITGGPGTGKTLVALRAIERALERLRAEGHPDPRALFLTYTRTLAQTAGTVILSTFSGPLRYAVTAATLDQVVHEILRAQEEELVLVTDLRDVISEARSQAFDRPLSPTAARDRELARSLSGLSNDYLASEISEVIVGRGLQSLEEYHQADRAGRRRRLTALQREAVWCVYQALGAILETRGLVLLDQCRQRALERVRAGSSHQYDVVVVDEAQDLSLVALRLARALCRDPRFFLLAGDTCQAIYQRAFSWRLVEHEFGRLRRLPLGVAHRCTQAITAAAQAYLQRWSSGDRVRECVIEEHRQRSPGERPRLLLLERWELWPVILARELSSLRMRHRLLWNACAIVVPTNMLAQQAVQLLEPKGIPIEFVAHGQPISTKATVKLFTWHNAKGLEFPLVVVLLPDWSPPPASRPNPPVEEAREAVEFWRQAATVAMTRALRMLVVVRPAQGQSPLLDSFDETLWDVERVSGAPDGSVPDRAIG